LKLLGYPWLLLKTLALLYYYETGASQSVPLHFSTLPQGVPVDYYDPEFFSQLQPQLCYKITNKSIVLLPDIEETFTYSQDEQLSNKAFMQKYGKDILARYKLDDLSNVESEKISADEEDFDETEEMEY